MAHDAEILALRKQLIQARSALCRAQIRGEYSAIRQRLNWVGGTGLAALPGPLLSTARTVLIDFAIHHIGHGRVARMLAFASRVLVVAKVGATAFALLKCAPPTPASVRQRTDQSHIAL